MALKDDKEVMEGKTYETIHDHKTHTRDQSGQESLVESSDEGDLKPRINELARALTHSSVKDAHGNHVNPFDGSHDNPLLDPTSDKFSARAWTRTLMGIQSRDPERYPQRVAGIAYTNLSAHGFGEATDYQKTFGNYPLETGELFRRLIGRRQQTKIQILRNFDGLVRSGEMLVVLGRPGSGCSTLLKTISGETDGFFVDESSKINYQGISIEQMHKDFRGECMYQVGDSFQLTRSIDLRTDPWLTFDEGRSRRSLPPTYSWSNT